MFYDGSLFVDYLELSRRRSCSSLVIFGLYKLGPVCFQNFRVHDSPIALFLRVFHSPDSTSGTKGVLTMPDYLSTG